MCDVLKRDSARPPALTPALSTTNGRILPRVLSRPKPSVLRQFSPSNHPPTATGNSTSELSQRVRSHSPLPGGEGQGEGEHHTNFSANHQAHRPTPKLAIHHSSRILQP